MANKAVFLKRLSKSPAEFLESVPHSLPKNQKSGPTHWKPSRLALFIKGLVHLHGFADVQHHEV